MKAALPVLLAGALLAACGTSTSASAPAVTQGLGLPPDTVDLAPADGDLAKQLPAAAKKAKELGLAPFVQVYGDWCASCRKLRAAMDDPRMREAFRGTYVVRVDTKWFGQELESGLWLPGALQVPAFYVLRDDGTFGAGLAGDAWGPDLPENMAPALQGYFRAYGAKP